MAKRFIDTEFYRSPYVRSLKGAMKGLYSFIICDCSAAGIWTKDIPVAEVYTDLKITEKEFQDSFVKTGKCVDLSNGKFFFPDFIQHQYPNGLQEKNTAHINVIKELKKYHLVDENLKVLDSPFKGSKDMDKDKVKDKETGKGKEKDNTGLGEKKSAKNFKPPELNEVEIFFQIEGFPREFAEHVWKYYKDLEKDGRWYDGKGSEIRSWKSKMRAVWMKPENKNWNESGSKQTSGNGKTGVDRLSVSLTALAEKNGLTGGGS